MKQILCFGDSNTWGLIPGTYNRFPWEKRWTGILDTMINAQGYRVIEEGLCGRTTVFDDINRRGRKGIELLPVILETHNPIELIVIMLGTNDCKYAYDTDEKKIADGIEQIVKLTKSMTRDVQILLVSPISLGDGVGDEGYDTEFNEKSVLVSKRLPDEYRRIAAKHNISYIAASDYAEPSITDREHLDENGHRELANAIFSKLQDMLKINKKIA